MAENKTKETDAVVADFINMVDDEQKRKDSFELLSMMQEISGCEPKMWGPSIIGFGRYHYKYASGHEGDAPLLGFSPRKAAISVHVYMGLVRQKLLLKDLGKFKMGKVCIYVKRLSDIDQECLKEMAKETVSHLKSEQV